VIGPSQDLQMQIIRWRLTAAARSDKAPPCPRPAKRRLVGVVNDTADCGHDVSAQAIAGQRDVRMTTTT
jgi:hypothetical protein